MLSLYGSCPPKISHGDSSRHLDRKKWLKIPRISDGQEGRDGREEQGEREGVRARIGGCNIVLSGLGAGGWAGREGRAGWAKEVRAPIGGCNIVLLSGLGPGRRGGRGWAEGVLAPIRGCNIVLLNGLDSRRGGAEWPGGGVGGRAAGAYYIVSGVGGVGERGAGRREGHLLEAVILYYEVVLGGGRKARRKSGG